VLELVVLNRACVTWECLTCRCLVLKLACVEDFIASTVEAARASSAGPCCWRAVAARGWRTQCSGQPAWGGAAWWLAQFGTPSRQFAPPPKQIMEIMEGDGVHSECPWLDGVDNVSSAAGLMTKGASPRGEETRKVLELASETFLPIQPARSRAEGDARTQAHGWPPLREWANTCEDHARACCGAKRPTSDG
jgi:hypothetical protein